MSIVASYVVVAWGSAVRFVHRQAGLTVGTPVNGWLDCSGGEDRGSYRHPPAGGIAASGPRERGGAGEEVEGFAMCRARWPPPPVRSAGAHMGDARDSRPATPLGGWRSA